MKIRVGYEINPAFSILFTTLFYSCGPIEYRNTVTDDPENDGDATIEAYAEPLGSQIAINYLKEAKCICGPAVGWAGEKTMVYKSYEWLSKNADDSTLIHLTKNKNPFTKAYAFKALCDRKHNSVRLIYDTKFKR